MSSHVLDPVRSRFRDLAEAILPATETLEREGWAEMESIIGAALADRPESMKRQLRLFIRVATLLPLFHHGRRFRALSREQRTSYLSGLEGSRLLLLRRGLWGVRTLVYMGYYGQESVKRAIGYQANPGGWSARREPGPGPSSGTRVEPPESSHPGGAPGD